jgi:tetratricopeptide (TPR) repeat protein
MSENRESTPAKPAVIFEQACALLEAGRLDEAVAAFDRVIALVPGAAVPHICRGDALQGLRRFEAAVESYDRANALEAGVPEIYNNRGVALQALGKFEAAVASYDQAVYLNASYAQAWSNRGNALRSLGRHDEALQNYDRAIALEPTYADAHANRAGALDEMERTAEAIAGYERALTLAPQLLDAKQRLLSLCMQGAGDAARITRLADEVAADGGRHAAADLRRRKTLSDIRILHDLEQADHLLKNGMAFAGLSEARAVLATLHERAPGISGAQIQFGDEDAAAVARFYEHVMRYPGAALVGPCLNTGNDWTAIEERYFNNPLELAVIDDLLSPAALEELRKFCLTSTIWRREYRNQYFGAFSGDGFASPLHLQIATELTRKMPRIFGGEALRQLWAFKYASRIGRGINVHADFARVNLNFWITPDEANLDPASGGMIIYDVPAPASWGFKEYNDDSTLIAAFLKAQKAGAQTIPYRCNRAVLFNSNLFHETDAIRFKDGYENRRINVTYLFGRRLQS